MNRTDALQRWRRVADGELREPQYDKVDLVQWIEQVARAILEADSLDASLRSGEVLRAVGLHGRALDGRWAALRDRLVLMDSFGVHATDGTERDHQRGERMSGLIAESRRVLRDEVGDLSDAELWKRIDRLLSTREL